MDLMQNDEMLTLGPLGDDFEKLVKQPDHQQIEKERAVQLISQDKFAGKLHTADPAEIEQALISKFPDNADSGSYTVKNLISLVKSLMITQQIKERQ